MIQMATTRQSVAAGSQSDGALAELCVYSTLECANIVGHVIAVQAV